MAVVSVWRGWQIHGGYVSGENRRTPYPHDAWPFSSDRRAIALETRCGENRSSGSGSAHPTNAPHGIGTGSPCWATCSASAVVPKSIATYRVGGSRPKNESSTERRSSPDGTIVRP